MINVFFLKMYVKHFALNDSNSETNNRTDLIQFEKSVILLFDETWMRNA